MRAMKLALLVLALPLALYLALLALLWWGQERLIFQGTPLPPNFRFDVGPDVHERFIDVPGGRLSALHLQLPAPKGVVFFLHGNAGNLASWFVNADYYRRANFDLFMIDYRGYGKSSGRVESQAQLEADVRAAWAAVAPRYTGRRIVIYGRSLGSGLAAGLAVELQPDLTVLVSPYTSFGALAREHYRWVPAALLRYPLATDQLLPRVNSPVLLVHGGRDTLIPPSHSQRLAALSPQARLLLVPEAGHNDLQDFKLYLDGLRAALDGL
ncbi:MAG: alpha/beta fold hydrolase [Rubrivivax sp.]|nr:alpha/beta fold hydrolase [Rubrivivax sp.]MBK8527823.1 alpha/beta fold hydrolase [Rubrivivax sp.]